MLDESRRMEMFMKTHRIMSAWHQLLSCSSRSKCAIMVLLYVMRLACHLSQRINTVA